ncbi:hypothetical protein ASM33_08220 [Wolbachia endosymbiont of Folsomia candida]|nr:hypothetical protein ASM33_08220 [Wolbachia endosymbiont of Folsomia candida]
MQNSISDEKFLGEVQTSTAEYSDVFEERRQALTTKLPSEIELCKRSNSYLVNTLIIKQSMLPSKTEFILPTSYPALKSFTI